MTIARAQMNRQLYQMGGMGMESLSPMQPAMQPAMQSAMYNPLEENYYSGMPMMMAGGGIANLVEREKYGFGSKLKKFVRNIIPNEIAEIAVKAAPFVAPFNPLLAGAMAGIGGFDQTGRIGSSLKSAALTYGAGQIARGIGGAGFQEGFNPFAGADFSGGFTSGIGSLFSSPMGNLPFGSFSTPTSGPINLTPTQVDLTGIDDYGQLGYKPGYTVSGGGPTAVGNPRDVYDPTIDYSGAGTRYEGFTSDDLLKTAPSSAPIKEPGYIDLIKKAGSFENVPLSERFVAVKDLSSKALTDIFTKPVINPKTGETTNVLDKNVLLSVAVGASSYAEALGLLGKAGVPEPEKVLTEEEYQRLKIDPEKAKYKETLKPESFGIRPQSANGGLMDGILSIKLTPAQAMAMGGIISERDNYGLGSIVKKISSTIKSVVNPQTEIQSQSPRLASANPVNDLYNYYLENETDEEYKKRIMESINPRFNMGMAMGGRINYPMGNEIPVRQNQGGVSELDLRAKGGYIPVGIKEKADDVPAMLSKNEFVFTADAVRGAGGGNINKGAQKMYKLMKSLEKKVKKMKKVA